MPSRGAVLLLFLAALGVFALTARGQLESIDSLITLHAAQAWYERGDPGFVAADRLAPGEPSLGVPEQFIVAEIDPPRDASGQPVRQPRFGRVGRDGRGYTWFPIGHQALFVPAVAADGWLTRQWPEPAARHLAALGPGFGVLFWGKFVASFLSPLCAAGSFVLLAWIAARLGASSRRALVAAALGVFCTQLWANSSETMSNVPGTFCYLAGVAGVIGYARGVPARRALLVGGLAGGAAVLVRYPQLVALLPFWLWAAVVAVRARRPAQLGWLVLGGLPGAVLFALANHARFGDLTETGYSASAGFGAFPLLHGLPSIFVAPGKGIVWFSPLLIWALLRLRRRAAWSVATACSLAVLAAMALLFGGVVYWAAGQCWGIRYLSAPIALLVTCVLARDLPTGRAARALTAVATLGFLLTLGGHLTSYSSQQKVADPAARTLWGDLQNLDNNLNWDPRLSPLHSHWTWAFHSARGDLDDFQVATASRLVFGVEPTFRAGPAGPEGTRLAREDVRFHHLWWNWLAWWMPGFPGRAVALVLAVLSAALGVVAVRRWCRAPSRGHTAPAG
ncbi:MAG: hypothetical protein IPM29_31265 [Planctomycetes bacterium]|nr:hypothetical protein [Planctomycetota bacterium]